MEGDGIAHAVPLQHRLFVGHWLFGRLAALKCANTMLEHGLADTFRVLDSQHGSVEGHHSKTARGSHDDDFVSNTDHLEAPIECRIIHTRGLVIEQTCASRLRCRVSMAMIASIVMRLEETAEDLVRDDVGFMEVALAVACQGARLGEVPIGAVVVRRGEILASAHNAPITLNDPTAHAEVLALREAARWVENYRLADATLYVTVEPCAMCVGAMVQARVRRVVFGCLDPKSGALGSVYDLAAGPQTNHRFQVTSGICAARARSLLQEFFALRRGA